MNFNNVLTKKSAALDKAFDLMALICAGSFAVIVALRSEQPTQLISVALIAMVVNIFSTLTWHLSTFMTFDKLARSYSQNPNGRHSGDITIIGVVSIILGILSFLVTYLTLLISVI